MNNKNILPQIKPFTHVILMSTGDDLHTAEAEMRLRTTYRYLTTAKPAPHLPALPARTKAQQGLPPLLRINGLTRGPDHQGLALYKAFRALGRSSAPTLFIIEGTPASTPMVLQTDWGNTVIAPADGTLALLASLLTQRRIGYTLAPLKEDLVLTVEQTRMENPEFEPATAHTLRDIMAPAAALLLAGLTVKTLSGGKVTSSGSPAPSPFVASLNTLKDALNKPMPFTALKQADGSYLTNLTIDALSYSQWQDDAAVFQVKKQNAPFWKPTQNIALMADTPAAYAHAPASCCAGHAASPRLTLAAAYAPVWDEQFITLHLPAEKHPHLQGHLIRKR